MGLILDRLVSEGVCGVPEHKEGTPTSNGMQKSHGSEQGTIQREARAQTKSHLDWWFAHKSPVVTELFL